MSLASNVLKKLKGIKEEFEEPTGTDNPEQEPAGTSDQSDFNSNLEGLENKLTEILSSMGLVSVEVVQEEDGDVYADLVFEDTSKCSLQFYVEDGMARVAMLTADNLESPEEIQLPDSFVAEDGTFNLSAVGDLPAEEIKKLLGKEVEVTNQTEVYRRSRATSESFSSKKMKQRVSTKLMKKAKKK